MDVNRERAIDSLETHNPWSEARRHDVIFRLSQGCRLENFSAPFGPNLLLKLVYGVGLLSKYINKHAQTHPASPFPSQTQADTNKQTLLTARTHTLTNTKPTLKVKCTHACGGFACARLSWGN